MAIQGTYYLDAPSFGSATAIYSDASLTTLAPNGFYSDGIISREQASGTLLPQVTCPSCSNEFLVGFGISTEDACGFIESGTVTGDDPTFCNCTTFTGGIFSAAITGNYYVSYGGYSIEVTVTTGNPVASVIGVCAPCVSSFAFTGCGISNINENDACSDALADPKTLYSDCSVLGPGCVLCFDAALTLPVGTIYVFAQQNWDMDVSGTFIQGPSAIQC